MTLLAGTGGQLAAIAERLQHVDPRLLALAVGLQLATLALRALAWRGVLQSAYPGARISFVRTGCAYAAGVALNAFVPARGGEGAKVLLARAQIPGSSVATIGASLLVVVALDLVVGGALVAVLWRAGVLPSLPALPAVGPLAAAIVCLLVLIAVALLCRHGAALRRGLGSVRQGFAVLGAPRRFVATVVPLQLAAWGCRIGVVYVLLHALAVDAGLGTAALVAVLSGMATAVPVPGGAGSQQVVAAYALQGAISSTGAISFSLVLQLGVGALNVAVGLVAAMLLVRSLSPLAAVRRVRGG